ncbi:MAG: imidazoleglycerol-phosphate dehydratase [Clostridia bacterium]|nr:imidazoleglycerol-phosphate dehydratase [Clostridia bacterium]
MRTATVTRQTRETDITVTVCLDGGAVDIATGIGFFDHMLEAFAVHGGLGLTVRCTGDLHVDGHHTVEDVGIVLGDAIAKALGDKSGIQRYGSFYLPMDESLAYAGVDVCGQPLEQALAFAALDISGRPYLEYNGSFKQEKVGDYDTCLTPEFFRALAFHAGITLHARVEVNGNAHHVIEALFKAVAHALAQAVSPKEGTLSTKGKLD